MRSILPADACTCPLDDRCAGMRVRSTARPVRTLRAMLAATLLVAVSFASLPARADALQDVSKLVASGKLDDAEKQADAYLAKTPKDAQMRFLKGVILAQRGRRDDAVAIFTAVTQDYPELPEPYNNLAVIYAARGEYDRARTALETAIRVSPNYATAYENLGDVHAALAARAYQDSRRYDANNAAALRKLDATRALLAAPGKPAASPAPASASAPSAAAAPATPAPAAATSQRNVGMASPAAPRVTVGGVGSTAPEIIVAADAPSVPIGSNVVAIETAPAADDRAATSTLNGAATHVAVDPAPDPAQAIAAVTAAVRRWADGRSVATDGLQVRIDGDTATARFRETPARDAKTRVTATANGGYIAPIDRVLTLRRGGGLAGATDGSAWTVTNASGGR